MHLLLKLGKRKNSVEQYSELLWKGYSYTKPFFKGKEFFLVMILAKKICWCAFQDILEC